MRFAAIDPMAGTGLELQVIAAVVVGGVAISGGRGTLVGPLLGVALLATIGPALVFLGAEAHWEKALARRDHSGGGRVRRARTERGGRHVQPLTLRPTGLPSASLPGDRRN